MSEPTTNDLLASLRRSKRRWKALALTLLAALGLVIIFETAAATLMTTRARMEEERARAAEMQARQYAEEMNQRIRGADK